MKILKGLLLIIIGFSSQYSEGSSFYERNHLLLASPGAMGIGLYGLDNPALLAYLHQPDLALMWTDRTGDWNDFNEWHLFFAIPYIGFSLNQKKVAGNSFKGYNLSVALGNKAQDLGIGYEWNDRNESIWKIGSLTRPNRFLSIGMLGTFSNSHPERELYIDLGLRPVGNNRITLFADCAIQKGTRLKESPYSTGLVLEPLPGIRLSGRFFNDRSFTAGINLSFGRFGTINQLHFDSEQKYQYNTYGIRIGAYDRNIFKPLIDNRKNYLEMELNGTIVYQRYLLFDKNPSLLSLIKTIELAKKEPGINGIAINLSGLNINWELCWELREKLKDFKSSGKHIVAYIDEADILTYYLASVTDKIVLDPEGGLNLQGLLMGRMYFKNALDKIGIGVDEWRYFKYKSAAEVLSREKMSDADREQRQALLDDFYNMIKKDICASRAYTDEEFDQLINNETYLLPAKALEKNLVDKLGRWEEVKEMVKVIEGKDKRFVKTSYFSSVQVPFDEYWGEKHKIAIIYGIGECAMDTGIKARNLVKDIEWATNRKDIRAIVFRVDSPGGDPLASDIVAEALKKCKKKKPVIVSQGSVAGSGGYWLSMYGEPIVSSPFTITGSIGVIGVWLYNKEFKEKLGFSTDFVKAGEHADLGFGVTYPFIGTLPDRNLTDEEKKKMEISIKTLYCKFVEKVAQSRNKEPKRIEEIAQGRVWSGLRGKEIGLVDTIGSLETAIIIAKEKAGLKKDAEVTIIELPKPQLFSPEILQPRVVMTNSNYQKYMDYLKFLIEHNGDVLLLMPEEDILMSGWHYLK
jgi:protease-4